MSLNLAGIVHASARRFPEDVALVYGEERISQVLLAQKVLRFSAVLREHGVERGDRVALMAPNLPAFSVAYFGILSLGAIVVPMSILLSSDEVSQILEDSGARILVLWSGATERGLPGYEQSSGCDPLICIREIGDEIPAGAIDFDLAVDAAVPLDDVVQTSPDDTAVIFYTSGTTGRSKGAEVTHFNLYSNARWVSEHSLSVPPQNMVCWGPGHVTLAALPLSHSFGQTCMQNASLVHGGAVSLLPRFAPEAALEAIERHAVTVMAAVPTMLHGLLKAQEEVQARVTSLQYVLVGGAPIPMELVVRFEEAFQVEILEGYGLSEASPVVAFRTVNCPRVSGSVGRPILGLELRIVDDQDCEVTPGERGEIVVCGEPVMKGYYGQPEATNEAMRGGWLHTGDVGYVDDLNNVFVVDRKKDVIIRGGYNIYPCEVEEVLYTHPAVSEVAVVGVPHEVLGEEVRACVVLRNGDCVSCDALIAYC
ncbi:MAG: AMP-binding protein, partial [bacterium]|nr:AMP-binding protein [bacterium]